jgi:hypothetical protein
MVGHDIHYPELSRLAILGGARICFYLAYESANTSVYASESQVVCRSVESQSFTVFCNAGTGNAAGDSTGHSRMVSPTAMVYAEAGTAGDSVILATLQTYESAYDYARAGSITPSLSVYWQEGLDVLRINNPEFYGDSTLPPIIAAVTPGPGIAPTGLEYIQQLTLIQGNMPPPSWSLLQGPVGAQIDGSGRINGWTPTVDQIGNLYSFQVEANNVYGSDMETWQVRVKSRGDLDDDGDADQSDFGLFQKCMSGNSQLYASGCGNADLNGDGFVDSLDLTIFLGCMAGPNIAPHG